MKGVIIVNAYYDSSDYLYQPHRIKEEGALMGIDIDVVKNNFFPAFIDGENIACNIKDYDFCIFYDKDLYTLALLEKANVRVFNSFKAVATCDDKNYTYIALTNNGIKMPKTLSGLLCYNENNAVDENAISRVENLLNYPIVVKKCMGSLGEGVILAKNREELLTAIEKVKTDKYVIQECVKTSIGRDIRVIVIGDEVVGAIERKSNGFTSNVHSGGKVTKYHLNASQKEYAVKIAKLLNLDYCGIDFLVDKDGNFVTCEVNSNAFFKGFEKATSINVARKYLEYIVSKIGSVSRL